MTQQLFSYIPSKDSDTLTFIGQNTGPDVLTAFNRVEVPSNKNAAFITCVGGGGAGGNGAGGFGISTYPTPLAGGAGGGSGGSLMMYVPTLFLPKILYVKAGTGANANLGYAGTGSYVMFRPDSSYQSMNIICYSTAGNNGTYGTSNGTTPAGGSGGFGAVYLRGSNYSTFSGKTGGSGGVSAAGPVLKYFDGNLNFVGGGAGGGGFLLTGAGAGSAYSGASTSFINSNYSQVGVIPDILGAPSGSSASSVASVTGNKGLNFKQNLNINNNYITNIFSNIFSGGLGGGGRAAADGGVGGDGAYGCGGGGGGASTTWGSIGGNGGPGFVTITFL